MQIDPYILTFSALTVIATIWMGFWSARKSKTTSDFFVAGRSVSVGWNASAISGEYLSAASFMGVAGMVMSSGYDALWYPVCYACGYLFLLLFIAGPLRRFGAYTIPDFAEGRFDSPVFRKIAVVFVLFIGFFYTMPQMKGAGTTLAYIFPGLPYWVGVVLVGAVITLNVALGGMKGITLVQAFQYWAKMFAISVPIFVLMAVYGHYGKQVGVNGGNFEPRTSNSELRTNAAASFNVQGSEFKVQSFGVPRFEFQTIDSELEKSSAPMTFQQLLWRTRAKAKAMLRGPQSTTIAPGMIRFQNYEVLRALPVYEKLSGRTMLKVNVDYGSPKLSYTNTTTLTRAQATAELETAFATASGWAFLHVDEYTTIVAPRSRTNEIWQHVSAVGLLPVRREALPDKAPRDETWLNPFGPLTTKAAKNAAAAIGRRANPRTADFIPIASPDAASQARSATLKSGSTKIDSPLPAGSLMNIDRALTRITQAFGVHSFRTTDVPTTISGAASPTQLGYESGLAFVKQTLAQNGVALLEKGNSVYAVPTGRTDFYEARLQDAQNPIPLRADLPPEQRMTVNLDSPTVSQALAVYAELTGRQLVPHTNSITERVDDLLGGKLSQLKLISRTPLPDSGVRIHADGAFTALDVKAAIEAHLRTNGISLVAAGEKGFRVQRAPGILPGSAPQQDTAYGTSTTETRQDAGGALEKAWLDKHEKPLALLYTYSLIIALVCGTAGLPHILVRFYTNPDGTAAKRTTMWVMILIGVFYLFPPIFGVMGRNLLPSLYAGTGAKGTDKVVLELPRVVSQSASESEGQKPGAARLTQSPTDSLTHISKKRRIPWGSILSGITCAGAFAAFMSTFSGLLVSMTGALAHDVYGRILRPKATPEQRLRMFKISAVLIGGVAILLGSFVEPLQINFMVGQAFAIAAASYFPLLFMSVWWRGMTMKGAAAGMLTGGICALAAVTITNFSDLKWINLADFWAANPLLRILCEQPAIWTVPLAIALMVIVSKLTKREVPEDSRMKMLVLHAPEQLGLKQEYIQEHQPH